MCDILLLLFFAQPALTYPVAPINGEPAAVWCDVMQWQHFVRTGENVTLSPQYVLSTAAKRYEDVYLLHGLSSPALGWQIAHDFGSCPQALCPRRTLTPERCDSAAAPYRVGGLLTLAAIPDCTAAMAFVSANPGAAVVLTTDGYDSYALLDVDQDHGLWITHDSSGRAVLQWLDVAQGSALWESMIRGNWFPADNYMVAVLPGDIAAVVGGE